MNDTNTTPSEGQYVLAIPRENDARQGYVVKVSPEQSQAEIQWFSWMTAAPNGTPTWLSLSAFHEGRAIAFDTEEEFRAAADALIREITERQREEMQVAFSPLSPAKRTKPTRPSSVESFSDFVRRFGCDRKLPK